MNQAKFDAIVQSFTEARDRRGERLNVHSLLIEQQGECYAHHFNGEAAPRDIRSISKTVMTVLLGVVMKGAEAGKYPPINEETFIYPFIKDVIQLTNEANEARLKKVQIKHLLTHTVGYDDVLMMRGDIVDMDPFTYVDYVINYPLVHEPGEHYLYSNAGFYLLAVVLQEFLGEDLLTFSQRELFTPLGIEQVKWEKYGDYVAGATRLWLQAEDLHQFGRLFLRGGEVNGEQLVPQDWVTKMTSLRERTEKNDTPGAIFRRFGYGYGIWLTKEAIYFGHGTAGQTLVMIPEHDAVIITLSEQVDMKPIEKLIDEIIRQDIG